MIKLLLCLVCSLLIGAVMLQLRQQHRDLGNQNNRLHDRIEACQSKLWNQQLRIAEYTSPSTLSKTLTDHDLRLSPLMPGAPEPQPASATEGATAAAE
jgi:hypothetical protein